MIQEKRKHRKSKKKPSAMAQVHNRVNAGVMDGVVYGGMMEAAEPEDEEYEIGMEDGGFEPYGHAVNESTDCVKIGGNYFNCYDEHAMPFISLVRKDGSKSPIFVGPVGGLHGEFETSLYASHKITPDEYGRPSELKIDGRRTGRFWFYDDLKIVSFYSYPDSPKQIYSNCIEALLAIQKEIGEDFNIGEVMVDLWTKNVRNPIIMPVRWFNNGTAEIFLPIVEKCEPYESFDGGFRYRLSTSKGNFTADWKGDDIEQEQSYGSIRESDTSKSKKTMYITEEQMKHLKVLLENEGTNIKKARRYLEAKGYPPEKRQEILNAIRNDVPNSRLQQCKFLLGVTRLYFDGELNDGNSIFQLNKVLKYVASDAHVNEYDWNLNGEHLQTLVDRFSGVARDDLEKARETSGKRQLVANENYTIVPIDSAEEAAKYGSYTTWCVTHDSSMYSSYTNGGIGRFYFCLRNGFENEPMIVGENCPLDSYGLSMIAVSVTMEGDVNTITCRWNHDNGGNDNVMTVEQLENVVGRNFYQTFLPYTKDELREKGIILPEDVQGMLDSGVEPSDIFYNVLKPCGISDCLIVTLKVGTQPAEDDEYDEYCDNEEPVLLWNIMNKNNKILSNVWFSYMSGFFNGGVAVVTDNKTGKQNIINTQCNILSNTWFDFIEKPYGSESDTTPDGKHIIRVQLNQKENFFCFETGGLLFGDWYDKILRVQYGTSRNYFNEEGLVRVVKKTETGEKENFVDVNGNLLFDRWFDSIGCFSEGLAVVTFPYTENNGNVVKKKGFVDKNGNFLTNEVFDGAGPFMKGYAMVSKNPDWNTKQDRRPDYIARKADYDYSCLFNAIDHNGNLVFDEWIFSPDGYGRGYELAKAAIDDLRANKGLNETIYVPLYEEKNMSVDYNKYIKSLIDFMREQHLNIDPLPKIELNPEEQDGIFVKTGYYSPDEKKVVVFTDGRHPKDVLRTVAHEFIHHMQNLQNPDKDWGTGGDLEADSKLRSIEGEAFLLGNIIFREWTEKMKKTKELNESINIKKALKDLKKRRDPDGIEDWNRLDEIEAEIVEPDDVDLSSFNIKKHLNPKFWDDGHLDTRIRLKLLDIADDFFDSLGVDWVEPEDVVITGSLANYNWNKKYSDIDLHILVDYEDVDERVDFVREYFTMKKNEWNEKHKNLRLFGFPVEVYVQDANEPHASSGVYSIDRDEWVTEPDMEKIRSGKVNKKHVREMVSTYMNKIDCLIDIYKSHKDDEYEMRKVAEDASEMFDEIKRMRKDDLGKYGREMCDGNIIFKALRRSDYIGKLIKLKNLTYDKINSL